jgi:hypothetical protein
MAPQNLEGYEYCSSQCQGVHRYESIPFYKLFLLFLHEWFPSLFLLLNLAVWLSVAIGVEL